MESILVAPITSSAACERPEPRPGGSWRTRCGGAARHALRLHHGRHAEKCAAKDNVAPRQDAYAIRSQQARDKAWKREPQEESCESDSKPKGVEAVRSGDPMPARFEMDGLEKSAGGISKTAE